jgi:type VI secretion system FHA domain protein
VRLVDGDVLGIGEYEITVAVESLGSPAEIPPLDDAFGVSDVADPFVDDDAPLGASAERVPTPPLLGRPEAVDPLELLGGDPVPPPRALAPGAVPDHLSAEQAHFTPPRAVAESIPDDWDRSGVWNAPSPSAARPASVPVSTPVLPDDWDIEPSEARGSDTTEPPAPPPPPARRVEAPPPRVPVVDERPAPRPAVSETPDSAMHAFMEAAGLSPATCADRPADQLMRDAGGMVREVVAGLIELLAARATFKSEFRIEATVIRPVENNPLKFSADVQEALEHLLVPSAKGYLEPARAVREAMRDIKDHKLAMIAAMRAALESLLQRFRPDQLESRFDQGGKKSGLLARSGKGRYWEMYREFFAELEHDPESLFREVFGDRFIRAYEAQVQLLSKSRR